jgi:RNA polymerase sigma-70 factor (ECF subfamily)
MIHADSSKRHPLMAQEWQQRGGVVVKDEFLLEKARSGDQGAFLLLYERHRSLIFRFLFRLLGSAEIAEDITHDCFLNLIRASEKSQSAAPTLLRNRLYSAARDLAMEYLRASPAERVWKNVVHDETTSRTNRLSNGPQDGRLSSGVAEAVARLPPFEREALIFSDYEGLGLDEIAIIIGIDRETLAVRLQTARERLRSFLASDLYGHQ